MKDRINLKGQIFFRFFVDYLVFISRTWIRGIEKMLRTVNRICSGMDMKLAVEKMGFLTNDPGQTTWKQDTDGLGLVSVAQNYSNAVIALSRNGLDRAVAAHTLWDRCAVPAILYAT